MRRLLAVLALIVLSGAAQAQNWLTTPIAPPPTGQIPGTPNGTLPCAGCVGEVLAATVASGSAVNLTTGTGAAVVTLPVTAGNWLCQGQINFTGNAATTVSWLGAQISNSSGAVNDGQAGIVFQEYNNATIFAAGVPTNIAVSPFHLVNATPLTLFLSAKATFGTNTMAAYGGLLCTRIS